MNNNISQLPEFEAFSSEIYTISLYRNCKDLLVECYNDNNELGDWKLDRQQTAELIAQIIATNKLNIKKILQRVGSINNQKSKEQN